MQRLQVQDEPDSGSTLRNNVIASFDAAWRIAPGTRAYGELLLDDLNARTSEVPDKLAFQLGLEGAGMVRGARLSWGAEFTRLSRFVYTSFFGRSFETQGEPLGYFTGPDSRRFRLRGAWDPSADERAGHPCKSYGAGAIMSVPGRLHITWQDADTLRIDTDAGRQTRLFRFTARAAGNRPAPPTWQGESNARWERVAAPDTGGSLRVVTSNMRAGYLRKNGVPYSERATVSEHFDVAPLAEGGTLLLVTSIVEDPVYLNAPYVVSPHFKKEPDGSKWDPTPCSSTW